MKKPTPYTLTLGDMEADLVIKALRLRAAMFEEEALGGFVTEWPVRQRQENAKLLRAAAERLDKQRRDRVREMLD